MLETTLFLKILERFLLKGFYLICVNFIWMWRRLESVHVNFLGVNSICYKVIGFFHNWIPPLLYKSPPEFSSNSPLKKLNKKGRVGQIGTGCFKKGRGITYFHTNWPFPILYFSECVVCECVFYTISINIISTIPVVFHGKNLVLLNLINRYVNCTSNFWKAKILWNSVT